MSAISVKVFQSIVAGAAAEGVDPTALLATVGLEPRQLADPDGRLPRTAEVRLWYEAARATGDECFGLHLAERLPVDALGPLGFAVRSSATLGEAYQRVIRYARVVATGPRLALRIEGDVARLCHEPPEGDPPPARHAVEFTMALLVMIARHGVDPTLVPQAARFRHAAPARTDEQHRLFGPDVRFGEARGPDEIRLDRALLDRPQALAEPALGAVLDSHLSSLLAGVPAEGSFLERARAVVMAELAHGEPALDAVAGRLRMSGRSLQRRLHQEGTSLSSLIDRLRADLAVRYLSESRDSISEVGFLLGFSEVSTFHRAFRRWTGVTPATYRRAHQRRGAG